MDHVDVTYVANLARIELTADETERFREELDRVVAFIHQLDELDLEGIEPMSHPYPRENVMREDVPVEVTNPEDLMRNAPAKIQDLIRVPQMMEDA
jgi:aspartyl-tRNA(Asn)/glutamyl-tRNA(Gln) amidotransferase subunit C